MATQNRKLLADEKFKYNADFIVYRTLKRLYVDAGSFFLESRREAAAVWRMRQGHQNLFGGDDRIFIIS